MEIDTMFAEQKWNILKCLSVNKYSPMQLADMLDTSMANISQQLRLLEASQLVTKEKIKNRDKGKPRTLFSLSNDYAYLISASNKFAKKRLLKVNEHHKTILRIWFIDDTDLQFHLEKLYWKLEDKLSNVLRMFINEDSKELFIVADKKNVVSNELGSYPYKATLLSTKEFRDNKAEYDKESYRLIFNNKK